MKHKAGSASTRCSLLVVEDVDDTREFLGRALELSGYSVQLARNGLEALELLSRYRFDAVLTDLVMPQMSGLDLIRITRENPDTAGVPIIVMTAAAGAGLAEAIPADAFLRKPFPFQPLLQLLAHFDCRPLPAAA